MVYARTRPRLVRARTPEGVSESGAHGRLGLGVAGEARDPRDVSRDEENRRYRARHSLQPSLENCGRPQRPEIGRGAEVFTARSASEVRSGQRCSRSWRSSPSPPRNCQRSPGSVSPLRSLGEGGDTKVPRHSQSDTCFPGRRSRHLPPEPTVPPISIDRRLGTLGAVVALAQMLQTFARKG